MSTLEVEGEKMAKLLAVALKAVIPIIPRGAKEKAMVEEDLH